MIKKEYLKPVMKVVEIQQQTHILAGSGPQTLQGTEGDWEELE